MKIIKHLTLPTSLLTFSCMSAGKISTSSSTPIPYSSSAVSPSSSSATPSPLTPHASPLRITVLNVGQGDSTLIQIPNGHTLLIDAGPPNKGKDVILPYFQSQQITSLDAILVTHYHMDHIGGLDEVIAGMDGQHNTADDLMPKKAVYDRGGNPFENIPLYPLYINIVGEDRLSINVGETIMLDPQITIRCVVMAGSILNGSTLNLAQEGISEQENAASLALLIEYGKFRYLTSGDLTGGGNPGGYQTLDLETELGTKIGKVSAVHVNHHGSSTSSNASFVENIHPIVAFFSVGDGNDYHHPSQEVLERWKNIGAELWLTEKGSGGFIADEHVVNGNIILETDGEKMKVNGVEYSL